MNKRFKRKKQFFRLNRNIVCKEVGNYPCNFNGLSINENLHPIKYKKDVQMRTFREDLYRQGLLKPVK